MIEDFLVDFRASGFGVVTEAVRGEELADLRRSAMAHLGDADTRSTLEISAPHVIEDRPVLETATSPQIIELLVALMEVTPRLIANYAHLKPAGAKRHTRAHSDVAHLPGVQHATSLLIVKAMVALSEVCEDSGAVAVAAGSHLTLDRDESSAEVVTMQPGDLLLFNANVLHTSTDNRSSEPRISMWFTYALPWMRCFQGHRPTDKTLQLAERLIQHRPYVADVLGITDPYATGE